jgi:hypothetical protein
MPRPKRIALGGYVYHVLNRANGRLRIFLTENDFLAFEKILADGSALFTMRLCGYCIMSNHWENKKVSRGEKGGKRCQVLFSVFSFTQS